MELNRKGCRKRSGWTLVELVIVIVILGLIGAVALPAYQGVIDTAECNACQAAQGTIRSAVAVYYASHEGKLPDSLTSSLFANMEIPVCSTTGTLSYVKTSDSTFTVECSIAAHNNTGGGGGGCAGSWAAGSRVTVLECRRSHEKNTDN